MQGMSIFSKLFLVRKVVLLGLIDLIWSQTTTAPSHLEVERSESTGTVNEVFSSSIDLRIAIGTIAPVC